MLQLQKMCLVIRLLLWPLIIFCLLQYSTVALVIFGNSLDLR